LAKLESAGLLGSFHTALLLRAALIAAAAACIPAFFIGLAGIATAIIGTAFRVVATAIPFRST